MPKAGSYKRLDAYSISKRLVIACYELTHELPSEEKTNFTRYIRTAALSLHVNVAQGVFRKRKKEKNFSGRQKMHSSLLMPLLQYL